MVPASNSGHRVPFCILSGDELYVGTATGKGLFPYAIFEVQLACGEIFIITAIPRSRQGRYFWSAISSSRKALVPRIGRCIERQLAGLPPTTFASGAGGPAVHYLS